VLKFVTGNPGGRPIPQDEPVAIPGSPNKAAGLSKDAAAEWDRLVASLDSEQRLTPTDRSHVLVAAKAYGSALEFERKAKQRGLPHDEWRRFKTGERIQWDSYRKAVNDLCLSQGTRARAKVGGRGKATTKLEAFHSRQTPPKPTAR
jgi:hypothetical protein